jgi:hypothetical protein
MFFFEKKNQKTFVKLGPAGGTRRAHVDIVAGREMNGFAPLAMTV